MAVLVAESLLEQGELDLPDIFDRFRRWAAAEPKDIGIQTESVLTSDYAWDLAAAVHAAVDLGGDTDTVAAVTGGLAGARYGLAAIPTRWTEPLHVPLPGSGGRVLRAPELIAMAARLAA
ncbi:ADP-ribosylglycohydrolase family protein [Kitasatospora sp. NPDC028055]|uniref:ADP-ribosylglycohydrolase family protein n=1 Tax=Kitasatospora sp. NPDC028055 TaxID=3155653 RepID=UPI0033F815F9